MSTKVLSDLGRVRSEQEWQNVALLAQSTITIANDADVGDAIYIGDWKKLQVMLNFVSTASAEVADTVDVGIEMSMDGLGWYSVGDYTQLLGNGSAKREVMTFVPGTLPTDPNAIVVGSTTCGATVTREHLVGRYIRYKLAITDDTAQNLSMVMSVTAMLFREDIVRNEGELKEIVLYPHAVRTHETYTDEVISDVWEIGDSWEFMQVVYRITNQDTDAGDHLDTYIDLSVDGVDWYNVGMFEQGDGNLGALVELMTFIPGGLPDDIDAILTITSVAGATVTRPAFVGSFLRARCLITESGTDDESFTFGIKAYVK